MYSELNSLIYWSYQMCFCANVVVHGEVHIDKEKVSVVKTVLYFF